MPLRFCGSGKKELQRALNEYLIIGGMPEAVNCFLETRSHLEVFRIQKTILSSFIDDSRKYTKGNKQLENVASILRRIPKFIGQEVTYSTLGDGEPHQRTKHSLELLNRAMVITLVYSASPSAKPLPASYSEKHFKCILLDVGLVSRILGVETLALKEKAPEPNVLGMLHEQFVGQELLCRERRIGLQTRDLFCWIRPQRTAKAEVDYLVSHKGVTIPIEVKSGALGKIRSLRVLLEEYPNTPCGLVLSPENRVERKGKILKLPLFTRIFVSK